MKETHHMECLGIYGLDLKSYAHTPVFDVSMAEIENLVSCMNNSNEPNTYGNCRVTIGDRQYIIESNELSEEHMKCTGPVNFDDRTVWITKTLTYLIIGMSRIDHEKDCLDAVFSLKGYIHNVENEMGQKKSRNRKNSARNKICRSSIHQIRDYVNTMPTDEQILRYEQRLREKSANSNYQNVP